MLMMGQLPQQQNTLFYDFCLENQIPQTHLLRRINQFLDFIPIRQHLKDYDSHTGRPSIDPELMIRMLLVGYCYGIRSERRLCEEIQFNLAIDSKLRACDLLRLKVSDVTNGMRALNRSSVIQKKTGKPVKFEITQMTRESLKALIETDHLHEDDYLFQNRLHDSPHLSRRQYARIVKSWTTMIGLDPAAYGTTPCVAPSQL
jgi:integrase